jgi:flagellar biosynthesis chaperone FliJ
MENFKQLWQIEAEASRQLTTELNAVTEKYNHAKQMLRKLEMQYAELQNTVKMVVSDMDYMEIFKNSKLN